MKKTFFILALILIFSSYIFSSGFSDSMKKYLGKEIEVYLTVESAHTIGGYKGVLKEVFDDCIVLETKDVKYGKTVTKTKTSLNYIRIEYIKSVQLVLTTETNTVDYNH